MSVATTVSSAADAAPELAPEERARADVYGLLATLLAGAPGVELLGALAGLVPERTASEDSMSSAWVALAEGAAAADPAAVEREYHDLFIGLGRGELVPFGSWYLTGFLMEQPLARLRQDLARLGFERRRDVHEPEDHVAALCDVMRMTILNAGLYSEDQQGLFKAHVEPWVGRFFADLEKAESARFYRAVGRLGNAFMALEQRYFEMAV